MSVLVPPRVYEKIAEAVAYAQQEYGETTAKKLGDKLFTLLLKGDRLPGASLPSLPTRHFRLSAHPYPYMLLCRRRVRSSDITVYELWPSRRPLSSRAELEALAEEAEQKGRPYHEES